MEEDRLQRRKRAAISGHLGNEDEARALLSDTSGRVRATALGALERMHRITEDDVRRALADPEQVVRRRACSAAIPFDGVDLAPALSDTDPLVAEQAAWALGERGAGAGDEAVRRLMAMVTDHPEALCREAAVAALGAIGDEVALPAILTAARDKPAVRRRAVLALAPFEGPEVDEALERAKGDRDWQVRQAAEDLSDPA